MTVEGNLSSKGARPGLLIFDDIFPHLLNGFRIAEYHAYLEAFAHAEIHSTALSFRRIHEYRSFEEVLDEYAMVYPQFRNRVFKFDPERTLEGNLVYTMFLHNADFFLDVIESHGFPFVFTLYPGGMFCLDREDSDRMLLRVCSSPNLRKVIVTQKISHEYLIEKGFCAPEKIEFIYGGVLPSERLTRQLVARKRYKQEKDTFDICFVANKYTERGVDKGYDVFIEVAKLLSKAHEDIFFHVVGTFNEADMDVSGLKQRIKFYGPMHTDFFPEFYSRMDMILSPNVPFVLHPGAFDGFPTGCCIEAGLCGVAVFCTDILRQNIAFKDKEEIVIIPHDIEEVFGVVDKYYNRYDDLCDLGKRGQEAFKRVFDINAQMKPRLKILSDCMTEDVPTVSRKASTITPNTYYAWWHRRHTATDELKRLIPPGETFILVDQDQWGGKVFADRHNLPFLERAGQYWGAPPDDETAISELVRLRQLGANYMVFAWPAFWWLEHYTGLQRHLRAQSRCLLENDRLIVFDLRT